MSAAVQAVRFGWGLVLGVGLGAVYGFLRPLRRRHHLPADGLFLLAAFYAWLVLSFQICAGDIRPGITLALFLGAILWEIAPGRLIDPLFSLFWKVIYRILTILFLPFTKIFAIFLKILKKVFASMKKSGTMYKRIRRH